MPIFYSQQTVKVFKLQAEPGLFIATHNYLRLISHQYFMNNHSQVKQGAMLAALLFINLQCTEIGV